LPIASSSTSTSSTSTSSSTSEQDAAANDDKSVLFFAYGALMDPGVMQSRFGGKKGGLVPLPRSSSSSPSSRAAAIAVAFATGGEARAKNSSSSSSRPPSLAVAFAHRGGWATLVDLQRARAAAESPLWRLVPGCSRGEGSEGGGWSEEEAEEERAREKEKEKEKDGDDDDFRFISGSCFSAPAHGVLYALSSRSDLEALAEKEGGYSLRKVEVIVVEEEKEEGEAEGEGEGEGEAEEGEGTNGERERETERLVEAFAFVSSPGLRLRYPLPPREAYLEKMRRGAPRDAAGVDRRRYREWLERVPSAASGGTLDGRYHATPAGAIAATAAVGSLLAVVVLFLV